MLEQISIADFQPHLNESFSIRFNPEATHPAQLTKVTPWSHGSDKHRQPFTLELTFGWDDGLRQRINWANLSLPWWGQLPGALENAAPPFPPFESAKYHF